MGSSGSVQCMKALRDHSLHLLAEIPKLSLSTIRSLLFTVGGIAEESKSAAAWQILSHQKQSFVSIKKRRSLSQL